MPRMHASVVDLETVNNENGENRQLRTDAGFERKNDKNGVPMQCEWCDDECNKQIINTTMMKTWKAFGACQSLAVTMISKDGIPEARSPVRPCTWLAGRDRWR